MTSNILSKPQLPKSMPNFLFSVLLSLLSACNHGQSDAVSDSKAASPQVASSEVIREATVTVVDDVNSLRETASVTISFIHLNDLHAHLTPHAERIKSDDGIKVVERGGLARLATLIDSIRQENPNHLLMNIGDTYHGGVEALYTNGNAIVDPVNALNIDVGVPGNWDFAYGPSVTRARYTKNDSVVEGIRDEIKQPNFPNLAANVTYRFPPNVRGETFLPATLILEVGGVPVGFIGLTSDIVPRMHPSLAFGLHFLEQEADYLALLNTHSAALRKQGAKVVVVMSELGIHKDYQLAGKIPSNSIDVFFSAHTHEATAEPLVATSGAWVVEAGNDTYLGRMDISVAQGQVVHKSWRLLSVDHDIEPSALVQQLVEQARAPFLSADVDMRIPSLASGLRLTQPIDQVVGYTNHGLDRRHALENSFNNAYADMLRQYSGAQLAMTPGFRFDSVIPADNQTYEDTAIMMGAITLEDAYRFFPVPFTLSTARVDGKRLQEIIESNLNAVFSPDTFAHSGGWFDGYAGLELDLNLAKPEHERVLDMRLSDSGLKIENTDVLTIAGCSRPFDMESETTLCSYTGFTEVLPLNNPATGQPWTGVDFLVYGLRNGLLGDLAREKHMHDLNDTLLWPQGDYYQPLQGAR